MTWYTETVNILADTQQQINLSLTKKISFNVL